MDDGINYVNRIYLQISLSEDGQLWKKFEFSYLEPSLDLQSLHQPTV